MPNEAKTPLTSFDRLSFSPPLAVIPFSEKTDALPREHPGPEAPLARNLTITLLH